MYLYQYIAGIFRGYKLLRKNRYINYQPLCICMHTIWLTRGYECSWYMLSKHTKIYSLEIYLPYGIYTWYYPPHTHTPIDGFRKVSHPDEGALIKTQANETFEFWQTNFRRGHHELLHLVQRKVGVAIGYLIAFCLFCDSIQIVVLFCLGGVTAKASTVKLLVYKHCVGLCVFEL